MNISERNENLFRIAIRNLSFAKIKHAFTNFVNII